MNTQAVTVAVIIVLLSMGFVVSNRMSYQDGLDDQAFRCRMIAEGTYLDIDDYFKKVCKS